MALYYSIKLYRKKQDKKVSREGPGGTPLKSEGPRRKKQKQTWRPVMPSCLCGYSSFVWIFFGVWLDLR